MVKDVLQGLRGIDGLLIDWAEFPVYHFDELFTCCCDACATRAEELGYDWAALAEAMRAGWEMYHGLKPADADSFIRQFRAARGDAGALLRSIPHLDEFFAFKAASVELLYAELAEAAESAGRPDLRLAARGWAPPWNQASGFDLARLSAVCSMISPKIFTFDYAALPRWWGEELAEWNPALSEEQICDLLVEALDLPDELEPRRFAKYAIPKPGESHNTRPESHAGRLRTMIAAMDGSRAMLCPVVHSYLPTDDWKRMVDLAKAVGVDGIWIQMLGYLPTEKVAIARSFWDVAPPQPQGEEAHR